MHEVGHRQALAEASVFGLKVFAALWPYMLLISLAACQTAQTPEPIVRTVEVQIPIDDPRCAREATARLEGDSPSYPDTDAALSGARTVFEGVKLLRAGRVLRIAREQALMGALRACGE